jgi:hypothetical protein
MPLTNAAVNQLQFNLIIFSFYRLLVELSRIQFGAVEKVGSSLVWATRLSRTLVVKEFNYLVLTNKRDAIGNCSLLGSQIYLWKLGR